MNRIPDAIKLEPIVEVKTDLTDTDDKEELVADEEEDEEDEDDDMEADEARVEDEEKPCVEVLGSKIPYQVVNDSLYLEKKSVFQLLALTSRQPGYPSRHGYRQASLSRTRAQELAKKFVVVLQARALGSWKTVAVLLVPR